jgi:hypothetical protein
MTSQPVVATLSLEWEDQAAWVPDVFACLWRTLEPLAGDILNHAWKGFAAPEAKVFEEMLRNASDGALPEHIANYLKGADPLLGRVKCAVPASEAIQRAYVVAACIDRAFEAIRPSAFRHARVQTFNGSLAEFRRQWLTQGSYGRQPSVLGHVIPKGPLRRDRDEGGNGDNLENLFHNLTVALPGAFGSGHSFTVRVLPYDMSPQVPDDSRLGFVPLAESAEDLRFTPRMLNDRPFLDVEPRDEAALADRARAAVGKLNAEGVKVALFPELCVSPAIRAAIRDALPSDGSLELLVLGSGASADTDGKGRKYNECVVLNGSGEELWSQRKMNGYHMDSTNMEKYGVTAVVAGADHREWTVSDKHMVIVDTTDGRRIVVLICEDLNQDKPSRLATRLLRPDWIFSPVLDGSLNVGRWTQRRGWDLSYEFGSRVVVSNSMTLHARFRKKDGNQPNTCGVGLCIDDKEAQRFHVATVSLSDASPVVSIVDWVAKDWKKAMVRPEPPDPVKA